MPGKDVYFEVSILALLVYIFIEYLYFVWLRFFFDNAGRGKGYNSPSVINTKRSKEIPEISTKRNYKKALKSLPRGVRKAANNIKHHKTTADSVPEWLTLYGDDEGPAVPVACHTKPRPISFTFSLLVL